MVWYFICKLGSREAASDVRVKSCTNGRTGQRKTKRESLVVFLPTGFERGNELTDNGLAPPLALNAICST